MGLTRIHRKICFVCDSCLDELETNETEFDAAHDQFQQEDWQARKDGESWEHYCSDCRYLDVKF